MIVLRSLGGLIEVRQTLDKTYRLIDTSFNMVVIRLGDVLKALMMISCARPPGCTTTANGCRWSGNNWFNENWGFYRSVAHQELKGDRNG
jgi:hypothetical protein